MIRENLDLFADVTSSAILSPDEKHRFRLDRLVSSKQGPKYTFIGVNPSTADATIDDATVRKWKGFVSRWGGSKFIVVNLFTWRATDVKELNSCEEVNREFHSDHHLENAFRQADVIVPCWGAIAKIPERHRVRVDVVYRKIRDFNKPTKCFGLTKNGDPKHPLMLGYNTPLQNF